MNHHASLSKFTQHLATVLQRESRTSLCISLHAVHNHVKSSATHFMPRSLSTLRTITHTIQSRRHIPHFRSKRPISILELVRIATYYYRLHGYRQMRRSSSRKSCRWFVPVDCMDLHLVHHCMSHSWMIILCASQILSTEGDSSLSSATTKDMGRHDEVEKSTRFAYSYFPHP